MVGGRGEGVLHKGGEWWEGGGERETNI